MYSKTCLIHFTALYAVLNSVVNVIDDLYTLNDDIARKAEEDSLRQSSLREMFRCNFEIKKLNIYSLHRGSCCLKPPRPKHNI